MAPIAFRRLVEEVMDPLAARFGLPRKAGTAPDVVAYEAPRRDAAWHALVVARGRLAPNCLRASVVRPGRPPVQVTPTYPWEAPEDFRWEFTDQASLLALLRHLADLLLQHYPQWLGRIPEPIAPPPRTDPPLPEVLPPEPVPEDWRWMHSREEAVLVALLRWEQHGEAPPPDVAAIAAGYAPPLPLEVVHEAMPALLPGGWVAPAGPGRYRLTAAGRAEAERRLAQADRERPDLACLGIFEERSPASAT